MRNAPTSLRPPQRFARLGVLSGLIVLSACGGGGSSNNDTPTPPPDPTPPTPSSVTISGKAVDGPLSGATACYDLNDNGACDSGEPGSATTGADGSFSLAVAAADVGKHRIVVQVPATAIDADTGAAVGTAFTLLAPATGSSGAHSVFVSPLSTLVQSHVDATGVSLAEATALVQAQAGLAISPLADFTSASNAENKQAALVARLVQATSLAQAEALKTVVGQADISGASATAGEVQKQVLSAVIGALSSIAGKASELSYGNANGAALAAAVTDAAKEVLKDAGISADEAKAAIGVGKLPPEASSSGGASSNAIASAQLTALRYTNASDWYTRSLQSSAADNTPDAAGLTRYTSVHLRSQPNNYGPMPTTQATVNGNLARAGDLHWNGTAWVACKLGERNTSTVRDAQGRSSYNHCDGLEKGRTVRSVVDIAGQSIATVFSSKIRNYPGGSQGVAYADWGPKDLTLFGNAVFPAGAKLHYQSNTPTELAPAYDVQASAVVQAYDSAIAAGGDARSASPACAASNVMATAVATLEDLIARNPGKPCLFAKGTNASDASLDPNEWWGNSTTHLATLAGAATRPANTGNWYSTELRLRVSFAGGSSSATTYYGCLSRASTGSPRNCTVLGSGNYKIQTLGDARMLSFSGLPAPMQKAGYARVFIERGGKVYYGYQNPAGATNNQLRLNLEAANAVLAALPGMPPINPTTRYADLSGASQAALSTAKGVWMSSAADGSTFGILRIGEGGRYLHGAMGPTQGREQTGHELGWLDYDASKQTLRALVESNSNLEHGLMLRSIERQTNGSLSISASELRLADPGGAGATFARLVDEPNGIVGLWAAGSATELGTQHFLFLASGKVLMIDPQGDTEGGICTMQAQGPAGGEYASYVWDKASGTLNVSGKVYDTNGCAGLFDSTLGAAGSPQSKGFSGKFELAADGKTATVTNSEWTGTLYRISP